MTRRAPREPSRSGAAGAGLLVVVIAALAVATVLRPRIGYATAPPLLGALALGAGLGVVSLLAAGLLTRLVFHRSGSFGRAATRWPTAAVLVTLFVAAAAAPHVVAGVAGLTRGSGASRAPEQADFRAWQQTVVPIVVSYTSAVTRDVVFGHGLPRRHLHRLQTALTASGKTLENLGHRLASSTRRLRSAELARLTRLLQQALALGGQAQRTLSAAVAGEVAPPAMTAARRARLKRLSASGVDQLRRSQATISAFSLQANRLGASLFAGAP